MTTKDKKIIKGAKGLKQGRKGYLTVSTESCYLDNLLMKCQFHWVQDEIKSEHFLLKANHNF